MSCPQHDEIQSRSDSAGISVADGLILFRRVILLFIPFLTINVDLHYSMLVPSGALHVSAGETCCCKNLISPLTKGQFQFFLEFFLLWHNGHTGRVAIDAKTIFSRNV